MKLKLTVPLAEFISRLQELHAQQGNHPGTKLLIRGDRSPSESEISLNSGAENAGGEISACCFLPQ